MADERADVHVGDNDPWQLKIINGYLALGATFVGDDEYEARVEICKTCPLFGNVRLPGGLVVEGCTDCGCPTATKPKVRKYYNPLKFKTITVDCPKGHWDRLNSKLSTNEF